MGGEQRGSPGESVTLASVPPGGWLAQHAAVLAAVAEGHPLPDALAWAGVTAAAWPESSATFRQTLAGDPAALKAHHAALAQAEDRLHRPVPPIDRDAPAWVAFMGCVAAAPDVPALLAGIELGPNDVSRITRAWVGRLAGDAALRKRVAELQGAAPVMPAVRPGPRAPLVPSARPEPGSSSAGPAHASPSAPAEPVADPSPSPAALVVPTYLSRSTPPPALEPVSLPGAESGGTVDVSEAWAAGAALPFDSPSLGAGAPAGTAMAAAPLSVSPAPTGTVDVSEAWARGQALPFAGPPAHPEAPAEPASTGTVDVSEAWARGQALPFVGPPASPEAPAEAGPTETVDVSEAWARGQALPFGAPGDGPPSHREAPVEAASTGTVDVSEAWARGQALPFSGPAAGPPSPQKAPVEAWSAGTVDVSEAWARGQALPFAGPARAPPSVELTLEQYASFCVEIALDPARLGETRRRYGLTEADHARLDAEWRARLADARARAAFDRACAAYRGWLAQQAR